MDFGKCKQELAVMIHSWISEADLLSKFEFSKCGEWFEMMRVRGKEQ